MNKLPFSERIRLQFVHGSRIPLNRMPMENLRLLNKHRNLFPNGNTIHQTFLNRTSGKKSNFNAVLQKLSAPERLKMELILGKRNVINLNKTSLENLKFLNKHRNLFPNGNTIHRMYLFRTTGNQTNYNALLQPIPSQQRNRLKNLLRKKVSINIMPIENLKVLHNHRHLLTRLFKTKKNTNRVRSAYLYRTLITPEIKKTIANVANAGRIHLQRQEIARRQKELKTAMNSAGSSSKTQYKHAVLGFKWSGEQPAHTSLYNTPNARTLNRINNFPKFKIALSHKKINNKNVQNTILKFKKYSQNKKLNNAPTPPSASEIKTLENRKKYKQEFQAYEEAMRNWLLLIASNYYR
jgi:hypothetical protein